MSDTPIPVADEVDGPPADDELLRRRAIPEMPVAAAPAPVAAGRVIPPVDATTDLENRGLQSRTMGTPIPAAAAPMTPATPPQGSTADLEARSLATYEHPKSTPIQTGVASLWTKAENIHNPVLRVLGEIGAGGARALDAIGTGAGRVIPAVGAVESAIPGTTMNQEFGARRAAKQQEQGDISAQKEAQTEQEKAETGAVPARIALEEAQAEALKHPKQGLTPEETTIHDLMTGENGQPRVNPQTKQPYTYLDAYSAVEQAKQDTKPTPGMNQEQNKLTYQGTVGKVDAAGLPTDPKSLDKSLDAALKNGTITPAEHAAAKSYEAANPTPGTNLAVHIEGAEQTAAMKNANAYYRYSDADGTHVVRGNQLPPNAEALPIKDVEGYYNEAHMANIVQQSLNRLQDDLNSHPEIFDSAGARAILATSLEQIDRQSAGILVAGTGGSIPLPSGLGEMINTALQNKALDKNTANAVKQYIADYKAAKDKAIVMQMEMQNGKIGRGAALQFKAITDQLPNGATADAKTAQRQMHDIQETQNELSMKYPDDNSRGFKKVKPSSPRAENEPPRPDNVPAGYIFQENGPKGRGWYRP